MKNIEFFSWFIVNICVPVLGPIVLLLLALIPPKTRPYAKGLVLKAVQDGQLLWVVVALCASACYELDQLASTLSGEERSYAKIVLWLHVLFIVVAVVLVLFQALDIPKPAQGGVPAGAPDRTVMGVSIWMTCMTIVTFSVTHAIAAGVEKEAILNKEKAWTALVACLEAKKPKCR